MEELLGFFRMIGYGIEGIWNQAYYGFKANQALKNGERKAKKRLRELGYSEEEIRTILDSEKTEEEEEEETEE